MVVGVVVVVVERVLVLALSVVGHHDWVPNAVHHIKNPDVDILNTTQSTTATEAEAAAIVVFSIHRIESNRGPNTMSPESPSTSSRTQLFASLSPPTESSNSLQQQRREDYASAQRAATEAVHVGRETLESATRQGEQLENAEHLAEDTEYKLDRATRILRGMTWSGWLANKFSSDVDAPTIHSGSTSVQHRIPPKVYDRVPEKCKDAAQAVQNFHANLQVLETCETAEQKETCVLICDNMLQETQKELGKLGTASLGDEQATKFLTVLHQDLQVLCERQARVTGSTPSSGEAEEEKLKSELFQGVTPKSTPQGPSVPIDPEQENHLNILSSNLNELQNLAHGLNSTLGSHSSTLGQLEDRSESMLFKSKMVTRRTDRVIQKKSWTRPKAEFLYHATIRHQTTGKYFAVTTNNGIHLSDRLTEPCIFGVWQRQTGSKVFGLHSKYSKRWVGQNLLGNLVCSATSFGRREEWDADDADWAHTTLLCASAGWGNGGYLLVGKEDHAVTIGGGGLEDKQNADLWCIKEDPLQGARSAKA